MKPGDLVTLSAYALQSAPLWKWRDMVWIKKKPLVGLVVRVENNPWQEKKSAQSTKRFSTTSTGCKMDPVVDMEEHFITPMVIFLGTI